MTQSRHRDTVAERTLRNIRPGSCGSLGLEVGGVDHLSLLLGFFGNEPAEVGGWKCGGSVGF